MEYIIHGTLTNYLIKILKDGYIDNKPDKPVCSYDKHPNQIFSNLIFKGIRDEENQSPYWFESAIILDLKILKEQPFYATVLGGFCLKFKEGLERDDNIISGEGNLDKIPRLTKLKNHINKFKIPKFEDAPINFRYSHEILFGKKISLKKYCICVVIHKNDYHRKKIEKICNKLEIPIKYFDGKPGLDRFIDLINS